MTKKHRAEEVTQEDRESIAAEEAPAPVLVAVPVTESTCVAGAYCVACKRFHEAGPKK